MTEFFIEFYETVSGRCPVQEFLDELKEALCSRNDRPCPTPKMKRKTDFNRYLDDQLKDSKFIERHQKAGKAWDVALQIASLRNEAGMSQTELAKKVGTTQQQISRLESPSYEGHSLSMLRRVAEVLGAKVYVQIQRNRSTGEAAVAESKARYGNKT